MLILGIVPAVYKTQVLWIMTDVMRDHNNLTQNGLELRRQAALAKLDCSHNVANEGTDNGKWIDDV